MKVFLKGKGLIKLTQMKGLDINALSYEIESDESSFAYRNKDYGKKFRSKHNRSKWIQLKWVNKMIRILNMCG